MKALQSKRSQIKGRCVFLSEYLTDLSFLSLDSCVWFLWILVSLCLCISFEWLSGGLRWFSHLPDFFLSTSPAWLQPSSRRGTPDRAPFHCQANFTARVWHPSTENGCLHSKAMMAVAGHPAHTHSRHGNSQRAVGLPNWIWLRPVPDQGRM